MRLSFWHILPVTFLLSCQAPWNAKEVNCADTARLSFPIDLSQFLDSTKKASLWPFGVHGGTSPEGHLGIDFIFDTAHLETPVLVKASFSAQIISITAESAFRGSSCIVMDSACVEVNLCHLILDAKLKVGMNVSRGQVLGAVGISPLDGKYNLHFGTYNGLSADPVCPDQFLDPDSVECILGQVQGESVSKSCSNIGVTVTLIGRSTYPESKSRELTLKCADSSTQNFSLPAENTLCAPHLSKADRERMLSCLGSACTGVW